MSQHPHLPQKPRHIAPSIHVLAMRLAQNTAVRLTIGNTPLHILHLRDAQHLAPLFAACNSLRAITVHLQYVASATALEVFLKAAATCPSVSDVTVVGGATAMEAAAVAAGLAAFTFMPQKSSPPCQTERPPCARLPPRTGRRGREKALACQQNPCFFCSTDSSAAAPLGLPKLCRSSRERLPFPERQAVPPPALSCPVSPSELQVDPSDHRVLREGHAKGPITGLFAESRRRTPLSINFSPSEKTLASPAAFKKLAGSVSVTLELHRLSEEAGVALLEGLRCGARIFSAAIHLRVSTTDARLAGLRLAQRAKQVTLQHRQQYEIQQQQQQQPQLSQSVSCPKPVLHNFVKQNKEVSGSKVLQKAAAAADAGAPPCLTFGPPSPTLNKFQAFPFPLSPKGRSARFVDARLPCTPYSQQLTPSARGSSAQHAAWMPATLSVTEKRPNQQLETPFPLPHTPLFAYPVAGGLAHRPVVCAEQRLRSTYGDAYRRRGCHFFSSERRIMTQSAVRAAAQSLPTSAPNTPQLPRVCFGALQSHEGAERQVRTPVALAQMHTEKQLKNGISNQRQRYSPQLTLRRYSARGSVSHAHAVSLSSSSSISPNLIEPPGFRCGRSSSFSSWSSRSTSPQPCPPPPQPLHASSSTTGVSAARAYIALVTQRNVLNHDYPREQLESNEQLAQGVGLRHQMMTEVDKPRLVPHPPPSTMALCSPHCRLQRGRDALRGVAQQNAISKESVGTQHVVTNVSQPSGHSAHERRSTCSCFVCATLQGETNGAACQRPMTAGDDGGVSANGGAQTRLHVSPRAPTAPCNCVRGQGMQNAVAAQPYHHTPLRQPIRTALPNVRKCSQGSDGTCSTNASTPGITARTPDEQKLKKRPCCDRDISSERNETDLEKSRSASGSCHSDDTQTSGHSSEAIATADLPAAGAFPLAGNQNSCLCVSRTQLPASPPHALQSFLRETATSTVTSTDNSTTEQSDSVDDCEGYVVYPNSLKFLRARVAEINLHVVWHQVKAAKEAEEHAKRLAALEVAFAGRVTEQLSDVLMVLTDMEHGSRSCR